MPDYLFTIDGSPRVFSAPKDEVAIDIAKHMRGGHQDFDGKHKIPRKIVVQRIDPEPIFVTKLKSEWVEE